MLELTALRHFTAVAETCSFSRAAQKLFVTQPAVSHQIRGLERQLGVQLFRRDPGEVVLTDAGRYLREFCLDLFTRLTQAEERVRESTHEIQGTVRCASPSGIADGWLLPQLIKFQKRHPAVDYRISIGPDEVCRGLVGDRRVDFAIVIESISVRDSKLVLVPVFEEEYILLVPGGSGRRREPPSADDVVFSRTFIVFEEDDYMPQRWLAENYPHRADEIKVGHVVNHIPGIIALVKAGLGVAVMPRHTVRQALRSGEVTEVHPPRANPSNRFSLAYRQQEAMPLKLERLLEHLKAAAFLLGD